MGRIPSYTVHRKLKQSAQEGVNSQYLASRGAIALSSACVVLPGFVANADATQPRSS